MPIVFSAYRLFADPGESRNALAASSFAEEEILVIDWLSALGRLPEARLFVLLGGKLVLARFGALGPFHRSLEGSLLGNGTDATAVDLDVTVHMDTILLDQVCLHS